jgi:hypothetical protein
VEYPSIYLKYLLDLFFHSIHVFNYSINVVGPTTEASTNIEVIDALSVKKKVPNPRRAKRGQKLSGK